VSRARAILLAGLLVLGGPAWGADPAPPIPPGARIGIIDMMSTDVTHFHVGKAPVNSFMRTYRGAWSAADVIDEPLILALTNAGFEPVAVQASDTLRHERQAWVVAKPQASKLPRACNEELDRIMTAENLVALIIVASGRNSDPETIEGNRLRKLPDYVQGWGFSTSDEPEGTAKPVVFNLTQMLLVQKPPDDDARLEYREWGGSYLYEWSSFSPGPDLKALPDAEITQFAPVIADVMKRQIARLMVHIKPE
jgi:hypothetical protein